MTLVYPVPSGSSSWNSLPPFPGATINVIMHGDSMTLGGVKISGVQRVANLIVSNSKGTPAWFREGTNGISWNFAWSGAGYTLTMIQDLPARVTPNKISGIPNWLILLAGTNGIYINDNSGATEYAAFQTYFTAAIAALGIPASQVVVCTMLPRAPGIFGDLESVRTTYNGLLVSGASGLGHKLARFDLDANMGQAGQYSNTTNFQTDGVHPNDTGWGILAPIIYAAMGL
jgi:lysophospholipase L1-like esterase